MLGASVKDGSQRYPTQQERELGYSYTNFHQSLLEGYPQKDSSSLAFLACPI